MNETITSKNRKRLILSIVGVFALLAVILLGCLLKRRNSIAPLTAEQISAIPPIQFEQLGGEGITSSTEFVCDMAALKHQIHQKSATAYVAPRKSTQETLINYLGLDIHEPQPFIDDKVMYGTVDEGYSLEIDPYGAFMCSLHSSQPMAEMKLSDKECVAIANEFMQNGSLLCEHFTGRTEVMDNGFINRDGRKIATKKTVMYQVKCSDGGGTAGNASVSVDVNSYGEVELVVYNHQHYEMIGEVPLITVDEAYARVLAGKESVFYSGVAAAEKLVFENVEVAYWEKSQVGDSASRLPVYCFSGTSYSGTNSEPFDIMISAMDRDSGIK